MEPTHDNEQIAADGGAAFDPRQAAALLDHSAQDAQRQFDPRPPVLMALMAALVLAAYGVLWFSTRGQHPYRGPNGGAIAFTYTVVALTAAAAAKVYRRATIGVSGASIRQDRIGGGGARDVGSR